MVSHQPGLPVTGWTLATCWSPVSAWQTSTALLRCGIERAVGLVGDLERRRARCRHRAAAACRRPKRTTRRVRIVRLARARRRDRCDAELGLDHRASRLPCARTALRRTARQAAATGLDRPARPTVNVFFDFAPCPPINAARFVTSLPCRHGQSIRPTHRSPICAREIDRIDEAMHALLMERGEIIDRLIAVKKHAGNRLRVPARRARPT